MDNIVVISPKVTQESAKQLAKKIKATYINPYEVDKRDFRTYDLVFDYGFSRDVRAKKIINHPKFVRMSRDKIFCFETLKDKVNTVPYTKSKELAFKWIDEGYFVVLRELNKADNGKGLHYCTNKDQINAKEAAFYTKYIPHLGELRVNVWKGKVFSIYSKEENQGEFDFFSVEGQENQPQLIDIINKVYKEIPLDWFGLDLLLTEDGILHFLEINSAPVLFNLDRNKIALEEF